MFKYIAVALVRYFLKYSVGPVILIVLHLLRYVNHIYRFSTCRRYYNILWWPFCRKNYYPLIFCYAICSFLAL
jgi:hypothetical protein